MFCKLTKKKKINEFNNIREKLNETILSEALEGLMDGVIFRPWHIRCRTGWGPPLPAVQAPVWWQTSRLGWTDRRASGWVTGHRDAPHPLCTLQCTETRWERYECTEIKDLVKWDISKEHVWVRQQKLWNHLSHLNSTSLSPVQSWATYTTRLWTAVALATAFLKDKHHNSSQSVSTVLIM